MGKQAKRERKLEEEQKPAKAGEEFSAADKRFASTLKYLARGVIIGGSVAVMAGWLLPDIDKGRLVMLGLLCGCLAGVTMKSINERRQGR